MNKKALISLILVIILVIGTILIGCAPSQPTTITQTKTVTPTVQVIKWVGQAHVPTALALYPPFEHMAKSITAASGGRLEVTLQPAGALVPGTKEFDGVDKGVIDWGTGGYTFWIDKWPQSGIFDQVVGDITPMQKYMWMTSGDGIKLAQKMMESTNVLVLPGSGLLQNAEPFIHSKVPIKNLDDLKKLKLRAVGDGGAILAKMGVSIVFMGGGEIYESVSRNVIDGFELGTNADTYSSKLFEVIKYIYMSPVRSPHGWLPFIVNKSKYNSLPADLKLIVETATRDEALKFYFSSISGEIPAISNLQKAGVTIEKIPSDIETALLTEAKKYYAELAAKNASAKEAMDSLNKAVAEYRQVQAGGL